MYSNLNRKIQTAEHLVNQFTLQCMILSKPVENVENYDHKTLQQSRQVVDLPQTNLTRNSLPQPMFHPIQKYFKKN